MTEVKKVIYVTIDVEAINNTQVCAIGLVVGDSDGVVLLKKEWWIDVKVKKEDVCTGEYKTCPCSYCRCKREFWEAHPELTKHLDEHKEDEDLVIKDFVNTYDAIGELFGVDEKDIKLVSDNPEFDFGILSNYVKKYCGRYPLRYTTKGTYRSIKDKADTMWNLGLGEFVESNAKEIQDHNHFPSNDAENIYLSHLISMDVLEVIKEKYGKELKAISQRLCAEKISQIKKNRTKPY
jgi:hypothetical protein